MKPHERLARPRFAHLVRPGPFIWHYVAAERWRFAGLGAAVIAAACCAVTAQYQMKLLVDAMARRHPVYGVWTAFGVFVCLLAAESALWRFSAALTCRATISVGVKMRLDLFDHLSGQSMRYFADNLAGSLGQRITGTAGNFGGLTHSAVWRIAPPCVDFLGAIAIFATIDWRMAAAMGGYVVLVTAVLIVIGERGRALHAAYFARASAVAGEIIDVISNMWAVKAFSARRREWLRLSGQFDVEADSQRRSWMHTEKTRIFYDLVMWIMAAGMLFWALRSWSTGAITPGDVVVVSALTFRILHGARDVALALVDVGHQLGYIEDTLRVVGEAHTVRDSAGALDKVPERGAVVFRDVSFGYDPFRPALRHINLQIHAGEKLGIVGPSGAGKTTIVQLVQRLHDVQAGDILLDGQPIALMSQNSLHGALSVVPQEISLFHRTIRDNIRFGCPEATDEEVLAAARAARCEEFIARLPNGFDTLVGERGVKLSGGQRQRVGIARAFLKNAPILLLDEATSALDTESELEIQRSITRLEPARTVIAVAHRLSTLAAFDRIIVIDQGRIVEDGSPGELRRRGSVFRTLWRLQANGLADPAVAEIRRG